MPSKRSKKPKKKRTSVQVVAETDQITEDEVRRVVQVALVALKASDDFLKEQIGANSGDTQAGFSVEVRKGDAFAGHVALWSANAPARATAPSASLLSMAHASADRIPGRSAMSTSAH